MGSLYQFMCDDCGYETEVSGGDDLGMACAVTTILCDGCKALYNATTSKEPWDKESFRDPVCPKRKSHQVRRWKHPDVCPKCGRAMIRGEATVDWD